MSRVEVPFETTQYVDDTCLCFQAQRVARRLARRFDEMFRPLGLTNGQFSLLMALNRSEPPMMSQVAAALGMDRTTVTAKLKPLERRDLVAVSADTTDRRGRRIALTDSGRVLLAEAMPLWRSAHAAIEAQLAPGEADRLRSSLGVLA